MTYTYLGNKVHHEWLPLAMANGVDDSHILRIDGLYRWRLAPLNACLYFLGRMVGRLGFRI